MIYDKWSIVKTIVVTLMSQDPGSFGDLAQVRMGFLGRKAHGERRLVPELEEKHHLSGARVNDRVSASCQWGGVT